MDEKMHEILKSFGYIWLYANNCRLITTKFIVDRHPLDYRVSYNRIDVMGMFFPNGFLPFHFVDEPEEVLVDYISKQRRLLVQIESKSSESDFKKGHWNNWGDIKFVITPKHMLKESNIPMGWGWLEVEPEEFWVADRRKHSPVFKMKGIEMSKKSDLWRNTNNENYNSFEDYLTTWWDSMSLEDYLLNAAVNNTVACKNKYVEVLNRNKGRFLF